MTRADIEQALFISFSGPHRDAIKLVEQMIGSGQLVLAELSSGECYLAPPSLWLGGREGCFHTVDMRNRRRREECSPSLQLSEARAPFYEASLGAGCLSSVMLDPLEQAIDQAVRLISECQGNQEARLTNHLDALLAEQLKRVTADGQP